MTKRYRNQAPCKWCGWTLDLHQIRSPRCWKGRSGYFGPKPKGWKKRMAESKLGGEERSKTEGKIETIAERTAMKTVMEIALTAVLIMALIYLCRAFPEGPADLSGKPRAVTKPGQIATHTLSDFKKAWHAAYIEDAVTIGDITTKGHAIELPPGEEVVILSQEGEFVELKFVNRTTHPDVWAHKDSLR